MKLKNLIVMKLKNSNCDEIQSNGDETEKIKL